MNGALPSWIERLLGIKTGPGEGAAWSLDYAWGLPPWATLLAAVLIAAYVLAIYLREGRQASRRLKMTLAAMRLGAIALVALMIAQLAVTLQRTGLPFLAVVVDDSQSMGYVDRYNEKQHAAIKQRLAQAGFLTQNRWNLARTLLTEQDGELLRSLTERYRLRLYYLTETGVRASQGSDISAWIKEIKSMEPDVPATPLGAGVQAVLGDLRGTPPAAVLLLTDGINTQGPALSEAAATARRKGVPLLTVGLGDDRPLRELRLGDLVTDDVVFAGDVVELEFKLTGFGWQGHKVQVELHQRDKPAVLAHCEAVVGTDGQSQPLVLPFRPTLIGRWHYVVKVIPPEDPSAPEDRATAEAPRQEFSLEVRKQTIRMLLVQSQPSYEYRYLRAMLARDESIELHTVLQSADVEYAAEDKKTSLAVFPVRRDDLFAYDVVILGDADPALLGEAAVRNLADFVTQKGRGGALIFLAGPHYMPLAYRDTPLAPLLPVNLASVRCPDPEAPAVEPFLATPTTLGRQSPPLQLGDTPAQTATIWQDLPPLYWMLEAPELKPAARVLLENPQRQGHGGRSLPVLVVQYVGAGRVVLQTTDETWRWRRRQGDAYFARYWVQLIRYLARSKLSDGSTAAELSTDRREYRRGEPVQLRVRFADDRQAPPEDDGVTVVIEQEGSRSRRITLTRGAERGIFEGIASGLPAGRHHAWVAIPAMEGRAPAADFSVVAPQSEMERLAMDSATLEQAAAQTLGHYYRFADAGRLLDDLPAGRQVPVESLPARPLWNRWPMLLAVLSLLTAEWLLRKRGGMV